MSSVWANILFPLKPQVGDIRSLYSFLIDVNSDFAQCPGMFSSQESPE